MNKKQVSSTKTKKSRKKNFFPIVGIGASAGGLEALEGFFSNMPVDSSIAFIVVQHLDPNHKSIMASLLERHSTMKIFEVTDGTRIEPNCIYLNPPSKNMIIRDRKLLLTDPIKHHGINLPIDYFFRSLAEDQTEKAICIILSGTGSDGTLGLKAIKNAGGMAMVQEEKQAKYDGMPRNAIDTGLVDYVLPVEKMPLDLMKYVRHPFIETTEKTEVTRDSIQNDFQKIYMLIRSQTGHDFSHYKQNTIRRRIERRLAVNQIDNIANYVHYLQQTSLEVEILFKDLLITVTNFFRDPDSFKILQEKALTELLEQMPSNSVFRAWIPGCASGEEAYSIAIILFESVMRLKKHVDIQIFATDIDSDAIEQARLALYPESIAVDVSGERLNQFFNKENNSYRIKRHIREMVIFADQNVIKDPPFSKLHLVSCRNVFIYLDQVLQKKLLPLFHYTLNPGGILFLGASESIGEFTELFSPVDSKWKIYQRRHNTFEKNIKYPRIAFQETDVVHSKGEKKLFSGELEMRLLAERVILKDYSLPCVLVNEKFEILYFNGDTSPYLSLPTGEPSFLLLKMARENFRQILSITLHKAAKQKSPVVHKNVHLKYDNTTLTFDLIVRPLSENPESQELLMVVFDDKKLPLKQFKGKIDVIEKPETNKQVAVLEQELQATKEHLQTMIEELETTNEELKSSIEELQSTNEELQSTNEEMETSKEELQSTNEELITVNAELQSKIDELSRANNDINNLLASTEIGTIFLDTQLRIKRFTPAMTEIFNLIQSDINRPVSDITWNIKYDNLYADAKYVLQTLSRKEVELQNKSGEYFLMRIAPYRTMENIIDGIVISFVDITQLKQAEKILRLATVVTDSNDAITVHNLDGKITAWNNGAEKMYGYSEAEALNMNIYDIIPEGKKQETIAMISQMQLGQSIKSIETQRLAKNGTIIDVWLTVTQLLDDNRQITAVATTERDISEITRMKTEYENTIKNLNQQLNELQQG
jgi:two-component system, chemotaxis family, CheB/CheR fusion protein